MTISMFQASVPIFAQLLSGLTNILDKAEAHCAANNIDESVLKIKNRKELEILKRYIKKQKRVLEKYEKVRNYTASEVMKNSILLLKEFEKDFVCWLEDNKD